MEIITDLIEDEICEVHDDGTVIREGKSGKRYEERRHMDADCGYLTFAPENVMMSNDRSEIVEIAGKTFRSLFKVEPEQLFWCSAYDIACAGPIPEVKHQRVRFSDNGNGA